MKMSNYFLTLMHFIPALKDGAFVLQNGKGTPNGKSRWSAPTTTGTAALSTENRTREACHHS